jgi:hypothetical protein
MEELLKSESEIERQFKEGLTEIENAYPQIFKNNSEKLFETHVFLVTRYAVDGQLEKCWVSFGFTSTSDLPEFIKDQIKALFDRIIK